MISHDRPEHLPTSELLRQLRAERAAGRHDRARQLQWILAERHRSVVRAVVRRKIPASDIADVELAVIEATGRSIFRGHDAAAFFRWLRGIARNQIAEYHRQRERHPRAESLDAGTERIAAPGDLAADLARREAIVAALGELRADHRRVVEMAVIGGYDAGEVCDCVDGMTEPNVYKIASRFRARLRGMDS